MDDELLELYTERLMAHGRRVASDRRLAAPDITVFRRSPICGSTVTLDIALDGDRVKSLGYEVRACSLGQVGVSVLADAGGPPTSGRWADLELLEPARELKNRHGSALLPFEAVVEGLERIAQERAQATCE